MESAHSITATSGAAAASVAPVSESDVKIKAIDTALLFAAREGSSAVVESLLRAGADLEAENEVFA